MKLISKTLTIRKATRESLTRQFQARSLGRKKGRVKGREDRRAQDDSLVFDSQSWRFSALYTSQQYKAQHVWFPLQCRLQESGQTCNATEDVLSAEFTLLGWQQGFRSKKTEQLKMWVTSVFQAASYQPMIYLVDVSFVPRWGHAATWERVFSGTRKTTFRVRRFKQKAVLTVIYPRM
jgi:hypothetical protein